MSRVNSKKSVSMVALSLLFAGVSPVSAKTLISPMVGGLALCPSALNNKSNSFAEYCQSINETSAELLENKLTELGPKQSARGDFEIGYTLGLALLQFVELADDGSFTINKERVAYNIKLLKDVNRKAVIYLYANHFSATPNAMLEEKIAKLDSASLMQFSDGSSPVDDYFTNKTYPWAIDDENTLIDKVRNAALDEVLTQLCALDDENKNKVHALTVLGEVHHMYPDFFGGMGYNTDFKVTDYSPRAVARFQKYLAEKYQTIAKLNESFGADFPSFSEVYPPSKNINKDKLDNFFQHIDYASSGLLTLHGWAADKEYEHLDIKVYVDGKYHGDAEYGLNRMDVYQAKPELKNAAVGYRYYLDIKNLAHGIHKVDIVHSANGKLTLMQSLDVPVMDRKQTTPKPLAKGVSFKQEQSLDYWHDYPKSMEPVYYNPLSEDFYEFRQQSIANEISKYANKVNDSCFNKEQVFSHQIAPMLNSDWSEEKIAVRQSLNKNDTYHLGFNTYGAAFYGDALFDWLNKGDIHHYGIPEVHPMIREQAIIIDAFDKHQQQGAHFISPYYIELKPTRYGVDKEHSKFEINPKNDEYDSKSYFNAIKTLMTR